MSAKVLKIDMGLKRLQSLSEKAYQDGDYLSALRFSFREIDEYGEDIETYYRIADVYENYGLQTYAIKWLFRALHICEGQDLPEVYEGLAVNYLNMGNEGASAYYYNQLIDVDDTLTAENKMEIAQAFAKEKKTPFKFVYPPQLTDFSEELDEGSAALKEGDCKRAIKALSKVSKGKDYLEARRMLALAYLLDGNVAQAERVCLEILKEYPSDIQAKSTLAAVCLEKGDKEASMRIAQELCEVQTTSTEELYKIATVCCENGMHKEAYEKFSKMEEKTPCDGRMLYFKAVAAAKSGRLKEAEATLYRFCSLYPDAEVGKYYLREVRKMLDGGEDTTEDFTYFYRIPQAARELACHSLVSLGKLPREEACFWGAAESIVSDLRWCFDEMDGMDEDLQYIALVVAEHTCSDEFLQDILLDFEVADYLKIETLRLLYERNEDGVWGLVLCNVYHKLHIYSIKVGKRRRKKYLAAYAMIASKFAIMTDSHAKRLKQAAELLYVCVDFSQTYELLTKENDIACAIYLMAGLNDLGFDEQKIMAALRANPENVHALIDCYRDVKDREM